MIDSEEVADAKAENKRDTYKSLCKEVDRKLLDVEIQITELIKIASNYKGYDLSDEMKQEIKGYL